MYYLYKYKMIVPVRCFSCNSVLADKWAYYEKECKKLDGTKKDSGTTDNKLKNMDPITKGEILDKLEIKRICCRRMMLSTVDMMELI